MPTSRDDFLRVFEKIRDELLADIGPASGMPPDAVTMTREVRLFSLSHFILLVSFLPPPSSLAKQPSTLFF